MITFKFFFGKNQKPSYVTPAIASALAVLAQTRSSSNQQDSGLNVDDLIDATPAENMTDKDGDLLPDSVEAVLGTDFNNSDSDFDRLDDYFETHNDLDPLKPDSNDDGLADYFEVTNVSSLDIDGDNFSNAWDFDNDGDGVIDSLDMSPFSKSILSDSFNFNIKTNGNPTYFEFQIRPKNPEHLKIPSKTWDWPADDRGSMKDLNYSSDDVKITPMLELTIPIESKIVAKHSGLCLGVFNSSLDDGANVLQANCSESDSQLWKIEHAGGGYYKIVANHSGASV